MLENRAWVANSKRRKRLTIGAVITLVLLPPALFLWWIWPVLEVFGLTRPFDTNPLDDMSFDQEIWNDDGGRTDSGNRRARMTDDLLKHHLHEGESKKEIVTLLGEGEAHKNAAPYINDILTTGHHYLVVAPPKWQERIVSVQQYHAGEDLGGEQSIDLVALYLAFDSNDRYVGGMVGWPGDPPVTGPAPEQH